MNNLKFIERNEANYIERIVQEKILERQHSFERDRGDRTQQGQAVIGTHHEVR